MNNIIRVAGVVRESIVDGPGLRFAVFTQGCSHACPECQNVETWDFAGGYDCEIKKILDLIDSNPLLDGLTLSGGDPLFQPEPSYILAKAVKERGLNVVVYTGYTFEELIDMSKNDGNILNLLSVTDILIDGKYEKDKRDLTLRFRGSGNQRIIDVAASLTAGKVILDERYM